MAERPEISSYPDAAAGIIVAGLAATMLLSNVARVAKGLVVYGAVPGTVEGLGPSALLPLPLAGAAQAHRLLETGAATGKLVLKPNASAPAWPDTLTHSGRAGAGQQCGHQGDPAPRDPRPRTVPGRRPAPGS